MQLSGIRFQNLSRQLIKDQAQTPEYDDYMCLTQIHYLMNQLQYHVENQFSIGITFGTRIAD